MKTYKTLLPLLAFITTCTFRLYAQDQYKIQVAAASSDDNMELAPAFYEDGVMFLSTKSTPKAGREASADGYFLNPWFTNKSGETRALDVALPQDYYVGPFCFTDGGKTLFFTGAPRAASTDQPLGIYQATKTASGWEVNPMPFNNPKYTCAYPAVSADGKTMVFASSKPGGMGALDLYITRKINGVWSQEFNLGPEVNTIGMESFPFIRNEQLWFSSSGLNGMGGLDVFTAKLDGFAAAEVEALPEPINSNHDDYGFIISEDGTQGWFSSNRNHVNGMPDDNIYHFTGEKKMSVSGVVKDESGNPLANADVIVTDYFGGALNLTTDQNGRFKLAIKDQNYYRIEIQADGYRNEVKAFASAHIRELKDEVLFAMNKDNRVILNGSILTSTNGLPVETPELKVFGMEMMETISTDQGLFSIELEPGQKYSFVASHPDHEETFWIVEIPGEATGVMEREFLMHPKEMVMHWE